MTRPDLAFAYSQLSKFVQYPGVVHLKKAAERVLQMYVVLMIKELLIVNLELKSITN
jgi:hypothetical protein